MEREKAFRHETCVRKFSPNTGEIEVAVSIENGGSRQREYLRARITQVWQAMLEMYASDE